MPTVRGKVFRLTDAQYQAMSGYFSKYDEDRDGELNFIELRNLVRAVGQYQDGTDLDTNTTKLMNKLDTTGNGTLGFNEFLRGYERMLASASQDDDSFASLDILNLGGAEKSKPDQEEVAAQKKAAAEKEAAKKVAEEIAFVAAEKANAEKAAAEKADAEKAAQKVAAEEAVGKSQGLLLMSKTKYEADLVPESAPSSLTKVFDSGVYNCASCSSSLFSSSAKFKSDSSEWPSFREDSFSALKYRTDYSFGIERREIVCKKCEIHIGHLFQDGKDAGDVHAKAGKRFCVLSQSLSFVPDLTSTNVAGTQRSVEEVVESENKKVPVWHYLVGAAIFASPFAAFVTI